MATISVPLDKSLLSELDNLVETDSSSRADIMRRALKHFAEMRAVQDVLDSLNEPTLHGDLRALAKKLTRN